MCHCRPVGVGAGTEAQSLDAVVVAAFNDAARRAARALDPADANRPRLRSRRRGCRPDATVEQAFELGERLLELECALLDPCLHVAYGALRCHRLEPLIGESRAAG